MLLAVNKLKIYLSVIFSVFLFVFFFAPSAFAVFNLTVAPDEGGFDLRFIRQAPGDFKQPREVTLRVTSDIGKQYRVIQEVIKPLSLPDGTLLQDAQFKMYPLVNSNSQGTLLYREEAPVATYDTTLYTSDSSGTGDSFKLVYTLSSSDTQLSGSYHGRIAYILQPIDSTQSQVIVTLNVYVELAPGSTPVIELATNDGSGRLSFNSEGMTPRNPSGLKDNPQVSIKVHSPVGVPYRIYQGFRGNPVISGSGNNFDLSKISFLTEGGNRGSAVKQGDLKGAEDRQLLYTSDGFGSPDEIVITYKPSDDFRLQESSLYRGRLNFIIEKSTDAAPSIFETLDLEINIVPVFDIYVYSGGVEGMSLKFGEVSYKTGPKTSDVEIFVESNMGRPYQVVQKVAGRMMNEAGYKVPEEDFRIKVKDVKSSEDPKFVLNESAVVREGDTVVFSSGNSGDSSNFVVEYELTMHPDSKGGNYTNQIGYSLILM